jgi:hypothetical protein
MTTQRNDELSPAIVAAIMAALSAVSVQDEQEDVPARNWPSATRIAPRWRDTGANGWRDIERAKGWRG